MPPCQWPELTLALSTDTPLKQSYSLTERPGFLRLWGNCYDLSSPEAPAMLLRKQTSFFQTFEVTMKFSSQRVGCEAGLVLWWSQFSYATIGVRIGGILNDSDRRHIVSRTPKGRPGEFNVRISRQDCEPRVVLLTCLWSRQYRQIPRPVWRQQSTRRCL